MGGIHDQPQWGGAAASPSTIWTRGRTLQPGSREVSPKSEHAPTLQELPPASTIHDDDPPPKQAPREQRIDSLANPDNGVEGGSSDSHERQRGSRSPSPTSPLELTRTTNRERRPGPAGRATTLHPPDVPSNRRLRSPLADILSPPPRPLSRTIPRRASRRSISTEEWARASTSDPYPCGTSSLGTSPTNTSSSLSDGATSIKSAPHATLRVPEQEDSARKCASPVVGGSDTQKVGEPQATIDDSEASTSAKSSSSTTSTTRFALEYPSIATDSRGQHRERVALTKAMRIAMNLKLTKATSRAQEEESHVKLQKRILRECGMNCQTNPLMKVACLYCVTAHVPFDSPTPQSEVEVEVAEDGEEEEEEEEDDDDDEQEQLPTGLLGQRLLPTAQGEQPKRARRRVYDFDRFHIQVLHTCLLVCQLGVGGFIYWAAAIGSGIPLLACVPLLLVASLLIHAVLGIRSREHDLERQPLLQRQRQHPRQHPRASKRALLHTALHVVWRRGTV